MLLSSVALFLAAAVAQAGWTGDPLAWKFADDAIVCRNTGFAFADAEQGREVTVSARVHAADGCLGARAVRGWGEGASEAKWRYRDGTTYGAVSHDPDAAYFRLTASLPFAGGGAQSVVLI